MQELADPALSRDRARETWQKHGRSKKWIQLAKRAGLNRFAKLWRFTNKRSTDENEALRITLWISGAHLKCCDRFEFHPHFEYPQLKQV